MAGWLDKLEDGGKFSGLTNKGFNYNGAWGGQFAMGGSIPGSVGFSYARTGAPSNGKYAKKTLASAQDGTNVDAFDSPIIMKTRKDPKEERTYYDPRINTVILGSDYEALSPEEKKKVLTHENRHAWQVANKRTNFGITHKPEEYNLWDRMQQEPRGPVTDENYWRYHDRKAGETDMDIANFRQQYPDMQFVPKEVIYDREVDPYQYTDPNSLEGEAEYYSQTGRDTLAGGGIIKDNKGYWNPDNWGRSVEIDSNDITMMGVNQPLVGIGKQTGKKKIMKPGKNYNFVGDRQVIEIPLAKNGSELTKLDQLTNWTNYNKPTVGGWLDNY